MIKDTLLPTVQKTHIGKYRTFPDNLQTAEKEVASTCERWRGGGAALAAAREGKFRESSALLMMTYLTRVQKE